MRLSVAADALLAVLVVSLVSFGTLRAHAWQASKAAPKRAMGRIRRALAVGLPLTALAALFAALLSDSLTGTEAAIRAVSPALADSPVGAVLTWVPTLVGVSVAVVAGYLGAFPYVREIRDVDVSAVDAAFRLARLLAVFFALFVPTVGVLLALPASGLSGTLSFLGFLAVFVVLLLALQPKLTAISRSVREPTDEERARIDRLADVAGLSPSAVTVVETAGDRTATVTLAGLPGRRHLFVTDYLLAEFDDDVVAGVMASKTGRAKRYYREYKFATLFVVSAFVMGTVSGDLSALTGLDSFALYALTGGAAALLCRYGERRLLAADDYAAERVGAKSFAETLEAIADEQQVSYERGRVGTLLRMAPSVGTRLDRLWRKVD